jgi:hypothetical protein
MGFDMKNLIFATVIAVGMTGFASAYAQSATTVAGQTAPDVGKWHITNQTSALEGNHTLYATLTADTRVMNIIGNFDYPDLTFLCGKDGLIVSIIWPQYADESGFMRANVKWRLDDGEVQKSSWPIGLLGPSGGAAQKWIRQLASGKKLIVQIKSGGLAQEATFDLTGTDVIGPRFSEATCGS